MTIRRCWALAVPALMVIGTTLAGPAPELQAGSYHVDPSHSYAHFAIGHMGLSTMRGRVDADQGTIRIGKKPSDSKIKIRFDPDSVDTGDDARDRILRKTDGFFEVDRYPSIIFESTAVHLDPSHPHRAMVAGRLTLHGVTRPVTLTVDPMACRRNPLQKRHYTCGFNAKTTIKRSDFGMQAMPKLIGDKVALTFEVEANKPAENSKR